MKLRNLFTNPASMLVLAACAVTATLPAHADVIAWTHWTSATAGTATPGSATGSITSTIGTIGITYSGQTSGLLTGYPSWGPSSTFTGGVVGNPPPAADNSVGLEGGQSYTETITFSTEIANPIFAVWSLGAPGTYAYFSFPSTEPFSVQGGGGSNEYGGTPLIILPAGVAGQEGNGIIQFIGDYTSLTFTTPNFENYYAFTIGEDDTATAMLPPPGNSTVPEPETLSLFGMGLAALPFARRVLTRKR